jgi:lipopolysaccharide export system permease protein
VSIFVFTQPFRLTKRIEAGEAEWRGGRWELKDATVFDFVSGTVKKYKSLVSTALEDPEIFKEETRKPAEMNFYELYMYYKRLENAGFKNLKYVVEMYGKLAYPVVNFVMILFGVAIALSTRIGGGLRSAGLGLVVVIGYWIVLSISLSLGNTGTISPAIAPWISPAIFGISGVYLFVRIRE